MDQVTLHTGETDPVAAEGTVAVNVRFFAAAAEAAGTDCGTAIVPVGQSVAQAAATAGGSSPKLERVLAISSFLVGGVREPGGKTLSELGDLTHTTIDVLPPFAGG